MKLYRIISILAVAAMTALFATSCEKKEIEDIENENYMIVYGCNTYDVELSDLKTEQKNLMNMIIDYYGGYIKNVTGCMEIQTGAYRIKGKTLTPASEAIKAACDEAEANMMGAIGTAINNVDFAFAFLAVSEASSGRLTTIYEKIFGEQYITE